MREPSPPPLGQPLHGGQSFLGTQERLAAVERLARRGGDGSLIGGGDALRDLGGGVGGRGGIGSAQTTAADSLLTVGSYLDLEQVSDPQISPDGKTIVYTRTG